MAIKETIRLVAEIDEAIPKWPEASKRVASVRSTPPSTQGSARGRVPPSIPHIAPRVAPWSVPP